MKNLLSRFILLAHSIRFRLVMWFAFILTLVLVAFSGFIYFSQLRDVRGESAYRMSRRLEDVARTAQILNGKLILPDGLLQDTDVVVIVDAEGAVAASLGTIPAQEVVTIVYRQVVSDDVHPPSNRFPIYFGEVGAEAHYTFVVRTAYDILGQSYTIILGSPFDLYGLLGRLLLTLAAGSLLTLAVAIGGGLWLADRALRPVQAITKIAREISETDLSRRINLKTQDEMGQLASTFDAMLNRLEAAFARQRQFVADASHELRTPLTIVNLETSRALSAKRPTQEYQRALGIIQGENDFMTRLVNDLLVLARMDNGQTPLEKTSLDLSDVALEAVERLGPLAARQHVRLETGDLPEALLQGNRQLLIQMVSNLIENGIKYAGGPDPLVRVETGSSGAAIWLRVADNGQGIPPEYLPHLFDRFYRVDAARTRGEAQSAPAGTGLGLSIVQSIAQVHGGVVSLESVPGAGATFTVTFSL